ncbi:MAG: hypothetical protein RQ731_07875 [Anaerosomatales bacterium]|nr:hypothetical protein [Anaerosomatales bacterium]
MGNANGYTVASALILAAAILLSVMMINYSAAERQEAEIRAQSVRQAADIKAEGDRHAAELQLERDLAGTSSTRNSSGD